LNTLLKLQRRSILLSYFFCLNQLNVVFLISLHYLTSQKKMQRSILRLGLPFLALLLSLASCSSLGENSQDDPLAAPSLEGKNVLFVYGGWPGHKPQEFMEYFKPWMESEGAKVFAYDSLSVYTDSVLMDRMDLIIQQWTMGKISGPEKKGLMRAIRQGTGFAGWHGGTGDAFRDDTEYQFMIGGQFVAHPGGQVDYQVHIVDHNDPITDGIEDFAIMSEQYYMHVDPTVKVLATTTFTGDHNFWIEGAVIPVMWKKQFGKGRIFYSSIGHTLDHLKTPNALETVQRGIRWASESKYQPMEKWIQAVYAD
jgi:hypothetical protein